MTRSNQPGRGCSILLLLLLLGIHSTRFSLLLLLLLLLLLFMLQLSYPYSKSSTHGSMRHIHSGEDPSSSSSSSFQYQESTTIGMNVLDDTSDDTCLGKLRRSLLILCQCVLNPSIHSHISLVMRDVFSTTQQDIGILRNQRFESSCSRLVVASLNSKLSK